MYRVQRVSVLRCVCAHTAKVSSKLCCSADGRLTMIDRPAFLRAGLVAPAPGPAASRPSSPDGRLALLLVASAGLAGLLAIGDSQKAINT